MESWNSTRANPRFTCRSDLRRQSWRLVERRRHGLYELYDPTIFATTIRFEYNQRCRSHLARLRGQLATRDFTRFRHALPGFSRHCLGRAITPPFPAVSQHPELA